MNNTQISNLEYTPKKSGIPKLIGKIISILLIMFSLIMIMGGLLEKEPEFVPYDQVNLYNIDYSDVYELKDLTIVSKYDSDDFADYYIVLFPDKDERVKAASLCCGKSTAVFETINSCLQNKNFSLGNCVVSVCATISSTDSWLAEQQSAYEKEFGNFQKSCGFKVMSTELSLKYVCSDSSTEFEEYCASEKSFNLTMVALSLVILLLGIGTAIFSFRKGTTA